MTSAGTAAGYIGNTAYARAAAVLRADGDADTHVARQLDAELLAADLFVALDHEHRRVL